MNLSDNTVSVSDEVCRDVPIITAKAARNIVRDHGIDWNEFLDTYGERTEYNTRSLFEWLGY